MYALVILKKTSTLLLNNNHHLCELAYHFDGGGVA